MKSIAVATEELILVKNILEKVTIELKELEDQAGEVFYEKGVGELENILIKKAQVVVDLPKDMAMYLEHFPRVSERLKKFSQKARECLNDNNFLGLCTLLDPVKQDGKNELERIIDMLKKTK